MASKIEWYLMWWEADIMSYHQPQEVADLFLGWFVPQWPTKFSLCHWNFQDKFSSTNVFHKKGFHPKNYSFGNRSYPSSNHVLQRLNCHLHERSSMVACISLELWMKDFRPNFPSHGLWYPSRNTVGTIRTSSIDACYSKFRCSCNRGNLTNAC